MLGAFLPLLRQNTPSSYIVSVADTVPALSDSLAAQAAFKPSVSESVALSDSLTVVAALKSSVSESVALSNSLAAIANFKPSVSESVALSGTLTTNANFKPSVSESVALSNSLAAIANFKPSVSESVALSGVVTSKFSANVGVSDSLALSGSLTSQAKFHPGLSESVPLVAAVSTGRLVIVQILDALTIGESVATGVTRAPYVIANASLSSVQGGLTDHDAAWGTGVFDGSGNTVLAPISGYSTLSSANKTQVQTAFVSPVAVFQQLANILQALPTPNANVTVTLAKLTTSGSTGSVTFTSGFLTAYTPPT